MKWLRRGGKRAGPYRALYPIDRTRECAVRSRTANGCVRRSTTQGHGQAAFGGRRIWDSREVNACIRTWTCTDVYRWALVPAWPSQQRRGTMMWPQRRTEEKKILLIVQCAWCRRVKVGPWFVHLPGHQLFVGERSLATYVFPTMLLWTTHCICPTCSARVERARCGSDATRSGHLGNTTASQGRQRT